MSIDSDFEIWWSGCWLKVGKLAAKLEYVRARQVHRATAEQLLTGRDTYIANHRDIRDRGFLVHPRTWLHQGRWWDEYADDASPGPDWFDECRLIHQGDCGLDRWKHYQRLSLDKMKAGTRG